MSFALYRKGRSHWVKDSHGNDVNCEIKRVELSELDAYRAEGWTDNIDEVEGLRVDVANEGKIGGGVNSENSPKPDGDPLNDNQVNNLTEETKEGMAKQQLAKDKENPAEASRQLDADPEGDDVKVEGELVKKDGKFVDQDHDKGGRGRR